MVFVMANEQCLEQIMRELIDYLFQEHVESINIGALQIHTQHNDHRSPLSTIHKAIRCDQLMSILVHVFLVSTRTGRSRQVHFRMHLSCRPHRTCCRKEGRQKRRT